MVKSKYAVQADNDHAKVAAERLRLSFEYLDLTLPQVFVYGLAPEYYEKIFACFHEITCATEAQIREQSHPSLTPKSIFNSDTSTYDAFPETNVDSLKVKIAANMRGNGESRENALAIAETQAKQSVERHAFEVLVSRRYGRIHGIVWVKVFYVVWIDPAHNLYPTEGIKLHDAFHTVKFFAPDAVNALRDEHNGHVERLTSELNKLRKENDELMVVFANQ